MRLSRLWILILLSVTLSSSCLSRAKAQLLSDSSGKSGGADPVARLRMSAWFLNKDREIRLCVADAQEIGLTAEAAFALAQNSFTPWITALKRVDPPAHLGAAASPFQFATKTTLVTPNDCANADLTLYLGRPPEALPHDFPGAVVNTYGAVRKSEAPLTNKPIQVWQPGSLWVAGPENAAYRNGKAELFPTWIRWEDSLEAEVVLMQHWGFILGNSPAEDSPLDEDVVAGTIQKLRAPDLSVASRTAIVASYRQSIERIAFHVKPDPEDDFGERFSPCDTGEDPQLELFVRAAPRGTVPCYYYGK